MKSLHNRWADDSGDHPAHCREPTVSDILDSLDDAETRAGDPLPESVAKSLGDDSTAGGLGSSIFDAFDSSTADTVTM